MLKTVVEKLNRTKKKTVFGFPPFFFLLAPDQQVSRRSQSMESYFPCKAFKKSDDKKKKKLQI